VTHETKAPSPWRRRILLAGWLVGLLVVSARAGQIQVLQTAEWKRIAEAQHQTDAEIPAPRGAVLDRDGMPLAVSRERYRVSFSTRELSDVEGTRKFLTGTLGVPERQARTLTSASRTWSVVPGLHPPGIQEVARGLRGLRLERELQRYHPHGDLARGLLGRVRDEQGEEQGEGGIEQAFDEILTGIPGEEVVARDHVGTPIPGERLMVRAPMSGNDVVLTLDMDLQEIAQEALEEAIERTEAHGGDVLVTDPQTGEILALVSIREGETASLSAIHSPFEPGSTLKPFTVAGLLANDLVSLYDTVDVGNGSWRVEGRTLHDVHSSGRMSIGQALRVSSNVGIAKAAQVLTPGRQYETLRDFGFGVQTGIELPGEAAGLLRRPEQWSGQSAVSLAIGYEIAVTPLQMAMAYGALANGGKLMKPYLVREVRSPDGRVVERTEPLMLRRVVPERVARAVSRELVGVVEDGTGGSARLANFQVAGKSGTARAYTSEGYQEGAYYSSFVGFFPADDPQLVVFVKLDRPSGAYYGGAVAAPVTRATMEAALAARTTPLDRTALIRSASRTVSYRPFAESIVKFANRPIDPPLPPVVTHERERDPDVRGVPSLADGVSLPDVRGLPARVAARRLHALGLRVDRPGAGDIVGTVPAPGKRVLPGDTIRLRLGRPSDD
jgi:cell division protein FtsI (penicillin-binding protein 3)